MAPYRESDKRDKEEQGRKQKMQAALVMVGRLVEDHPIISDYLHPGFKIVADVPNNNSLIVRQVHNGNPPCEISEVIATASYTSDNSVECHITTSCGQNTPDGYPDISVIITECLASKVVKLGVKKITITR